MSLRPRRRGIDRVWFLVAAIALGAGALVGWVTRLEPLPDAPFSIPWWLFVALFYVAERTVVHFSFNRHAHSFSLSEIPLVLGLFLASPLALVAGQAAGNLLALTIHRRQAPIKLAFNLSQFTVQATVALLVFRLLADPLNPLGFRAAFAAIAGVGTALVVANLLINAAIRLSGGSMTRADMLEMLAMGGTAAGMNAALALVVVHVAWMRPESIWIALVPPVVLFVAYRAYVSQRQEHARLTAMYEATRELHRTPQLEEAILAAARRATQLFGAETGEIILFSEDDRRLCYLTAVDASGGDDRVMVPVDAELVDPLVVRALEEGSSLLERPDGERARSDAMAAPLTEGETVIGVFLVKDPASDIASFGSTDLALLETLASQLSVSLENGRLEDSLATLTDLKEELRHQAEHDGLTGLANRALLRRTLAGLVASERLRNPAILYLDLDDFKTVNDTMGHAAGDVLLKEVAERLLQTCRRGDTVSRLGGDEFAVVLPRLPDRGAAVQVAERIIDALRRPVTIDGRTVFTQASIGIAHIEAGDDPGEVLRRADHAMYEAKWRRKGSFQVFGGSQDRDRERAVELRNDFQHALVNGELELHYQPVVDLGTGEIIGAEGLLRWTHPVAGPIPPLEALSIADEAGLLGMLGTWTVERACADVRRWKDEGHDIWVSINLNADQLQEGLTEVIARELATRGLDASSLVVEITETAAIQSAGVVLDRLHEIGVRIALDDFGTGYSSLARLDELPIAIVKVDRSFVERMMDPAAPPLAKMVVGIGGTLGLDTIAEGVETSEQRDRLLSLGCDVGQGFLFSPAVVASDLFDSIPASVLR